MVQQFWHVCYLKPRSEKKVQEKVKELDFESFLPLVKYHRIYKTSKKSILLPLFPGYLFVKIAPGYRHHLTAIPEVYRFIKFRDEFAKVSDKEIKNLKLLVNNTNDYNEICSEVILQQGMNVEVTEGPFLGIIGKMIKRHGKRRIVVEVASIKQSISVEIDAKCLRKI
jgi:transcription antitermination factor NusG